MTAAGGSSVPDPGAFPTRPYDLLKEVTVALVAVVLLAAGLARLFSFPDEEPVTLAAWSAAAPHDFTVTAVAELGGTSTTAQYGPPYNHAPGAGRKIGPVRLRRAAGVRIPVDIAEDFVLRPLRRAPQPAEVSGALAAWAAASADRQQAWTSAYSDALAKAPDGDPVEVARRLRSGSGADRPSADTRPGRFPGRPVAGAGALLRGRPHPADALPRGRQPPRGPGRCGTCPVTSGA
ncbi:hypothetical protein [Kitasatospora griseola]|uniref:hypothetical protein n=1 Tax=Kitasatospora griseola TaxID=2064 RepID=UPI003826175E